MNLTIKNKKQIDIHHKNSLGRGNRLGIESYNIFSQLDIFISISLLDKIRNVTPKSLLCSYHSWT